MGIIIEHNMSEKQRIVMSRSNSSSSCISSSNSTGSLPPPSPPSGAPKDNDIQIHLNSDDDTNEEMEYDDDHKLNKKNLRKMLSNYVTETQIIYSRYLVEYVLNNWYRKHYC